MAKIRNAIFESLANKAKRGKTETRLAVREDDIKVLENEGFKVTFLTHLDGGCMATKNEIKVRVSWAEPSGEGTTAAHLLNTVERYRKRQNEKGKRDTRRVKQYVEKYVKTYDVTAPTPEEIEDEELKEFRMELYKEIVPRIANGILFEIFEEDEIELTTSQDDWKGYTEELY